MRLDSDCNVCDEDNVMKIEDCLHFHCDTARIAYIKTHLSSMYGKLATKELTEEQRKAIRKAFREGVTHAKQFR